MTNQEILAIMVSVIWIVSGLCALRTKNNEALSFALVATIMIGFGYYLLHH